MSFWNKKSNKQEDNSKKIRFFDDFKEKFRKNRWTIFAFVAFSAISTVIYVSNVRNINKLAESVDSKSKLLDELKNSNQVINHKLIKLQAPERITEIATKKLGMIKPDHAPIVIESNEQ